MNNPFDRLQITFIVVAAVATIGIAVLCNNIIDRSAEHVKKIEQTNLDDKSGSLSMDIVHIAEQGHDLIHDKLEQQYNAYFSDVTVTAKEINDLHSRPSLIKMKFLRCDYEPDAFDVIKDLKVSSISFGDCPITRRMMDSISQMPKLTHLDFFRCNLDDDALTNIAQSKVTMFKLRKCGPEVNGGLTTARQIKDVARMPTLRHLDMSKTDYESGALRDLADAQPIFLSLSQSNVIGSDLDFVKKMPRLQFLELSGDKQLNCKDLSRLAGASSLKQVYIGGHLAMCQVPPALTAMFDPRKYRVPTNLLFGQQ